MKDFSEIEGNPERDAPAAWSAFKVAMGEYRYGRGALNVAWLWFLEGWNRRTRRVEELT